MASKTIRISNRHGAPITLSIPSADAYGAASQRVTIEAGKSAELDADFFRACVKGSRMIQQYCEGGLLVDANSVLALDPRVLLGPVKDERTSDERPVLLDESAGRQKAPGSPRNATSVPLT